MKTFVIWAIILFFSHLTQAQVFIPFSYWKTMFANLTISDTPSYNYGLLPTSNDVDKVLTLTNTGSDVVSSMSGRSFYTAAFNYKGGTYPGTNGTCGTFLVAGDSCSIVITANSATAATFNDTVTVSYNDTTGGPFIVRLPISAQFTAVTITSIFVRPLSGTLAVGNTQQLKCYGNTSDGGTIELTTGCSWSTSNSARVTVNNTTNKGLITGVANGAAATITATYGSLSGTSSITVAAGPPSFSDDGIGAFARYYITTSAGGTPNDPFSTLVNQRVDGTINFNWANGNNPAGGANNFGARWTGQIKAPTTGAYCIQTTTDDGVRLWIDNNLIINNWTDHAATTNNGTFTFSAGVKYDIIYEFYENGGQAVARLLYVAGACGTGTAVTQANLYPTATRALDIDANTSTRYTNLARGFTLNGSIGAIVDGAIITGFSGTGLTPLNATASNANGTGMAYVSTVRSQGISFDGIDDYISVSASTVATGSAARTIMLWAKPTNTGSTMSVTYYGTAAANAGYGFDLLADGRIQHSTITSSCTSSNKLTFGSYNHIAITLTGTTGQIYINGALDSSCTFGTTPNTSAAGNLYIGRDISGTSYYTGEIDDVGYWTRVLTAGEIYTMYERGRVVNPP